MMVISKKKHYILGIQEKVLNSYLPHFLIYAKRGNSIWQYNKTLQKMVNYDVLQKKT